MKTRTAIVSVLILLTMPLFGTVLEFGGYDGSIGTHVCSECNSDVEDETAHIHLEKTRQGALYTCPHCGKVFNDYNLYRAHLDRESSQHATRMIFIFIGALFVILLIILIIGAIVRAGSRPPKRY